MPPFIQGIDDAIVAFFQQASNPVLDVIMAGASTVADKGIIWIALILGLIIYRPTRFWGAFAALALLLCWSFDELLLKSLFQRARPFIEDPNIVLSIKPPHGYSFPSGHSASSLVVATFLLFCPKLHKGMKLAIFAFALLVAFSRMYLCVHYFSDVLVGSLVGALFGIIFGIIACKVVDAHNQKLQESNEKLSQGAHTR